MTLRRHWDLAAFGALALVHCLALGSRLVCPDLVFNYPFLSGDSPDWIANGLFLAGADVTYTARPPLLPLVIAALFRLGLLDDYPLLAQLLVHATICGLYALLRRDGSKPVAAAIATAWLVNSTWLKLSLPIMADVPAACLLFWCVFSWRRSAYTTSGLLGGLSSITQPVALVILAPAVLTWTLFREQAPAWRQRFAFVVLLLGPTGIWLFCKSRVAELTGDVTLRHWSLLRPHLDGLSFYGFATAAFLGPPALAVAALGAWGFLRRAHRDPWSFFLLATVAVVLGFFVLLYDFNSMRFLAYVYPLSAVLLAEGLRLWSWRGKPVVLFAVLLWAVTPAPNPRTDPTRIALLPLPPTFLKADGRHLGTGSQVIDPLSVEVETRRLADLARHHPYSVVAAGARRPHAVRGLTPEEVANDLWGAYFYDPAARAGTGYGFTTRLENLLEKRLYYLPASAFGPLWSRLVFRRLGELDAQTVFRARIPDREGSWIVLAKTGGTTEKRITAAEQALPGGADLALAETVAAHLRNRTVGLLAPESGLEPWQTYLPFVARMGYFVVTEPEREAGTRRMLGPGRRVVQWNRAALDEHLVFGRPWIVVTTSK